MLFIIDFNTTLCNANVIYHTTTGLGLILMPRKLVAKQGKDALDKKQLAQKKQLTTAATSLEQLQLLIAEQDYVKYSLNREQRMLLSREEQHMCNLFKNQLNALRTLDKVFLKLNLLNSSSLNVYLKNSTIYIPQCINIEAIDVPERSKTCFEDIPVRMISQKEPNKITNNAFLTKNGYLKLDSEELFCFQANKEIFLEDINVKLKQIGLKYFVTKQEKKLELNVHPSEISIKDLNFKHHQALISGSDKLRTKRELKNVYRIPHVLSRDRLNVYKEEYKGLFIFGVILFIIIVLFFLQNFTGIPGSIYKTIKHLLAVWFCCCKCRKS
jgi:hypothetical protein